MAVVQQLTNDACSFRGATREAFVVKRSLYCNESSAFDVKRTNNDSLLMWEIKGNVRFYGIACDMQNSFCAVGTP